jgi:hypothetical protein
MPRLPINYENACIYEIVCKDVNITQRYIGSTTNLIKRRNSHKTCCNNEKSKEYNYYVYQFIRENGSFDNWDVVLIEKVIDCKDKEHLHKRERFYIESLKAELNKRIPNRTQKEWLENNKNKIAEYREKNIEKYNEYQREYRANNKNEINERQRISREKNMEKYKEYQREYYADNKDEKNEKQREYYEKNKEKYNEYREENMEKYKEYQRAYYANKKNLN